MVLRSLCLFRNGARNRHGSYKLPAAAHTRLHSVVFYAGTGASTHVALCLIVLPLVTTLSGNP